MQIYVHHVGQQVGPLTEADVKAQLAAGTLPRQALVWWEGQPGWMPLEQTVLAGNVASRPPAPPVPAAAAPFPASGAVMESRTSGMAIAAMVCGLSSLLVGITFIPAIILGHLSLGEIKRTPGLQGRGMAITGLVFGYILPLVFLAIVAISVLLALGQTVHGVFSTINAQVQQSQGS